MTRRAVVQGNSASPFRVSGGGVDAGTADTFDLLFDGNQSPLRVWSTGYVVATPLEPSNSAIAFMTSGPGVIAAPAGQAPIFVIAGRKNNSSPNPPSLNTVYHTMGGGGFGGIIAFNQFFAVNFGRNVYNGNDGALSFDATVYVNFCIFRNIG